MLKNVLFFVLFYVFWIKMLFLVQISMRSFEHIKLFFLKSEVVFAVRHSCCGCVESCAVSVSVFYHLFLFIYSFHHCSYYYYYSFLSFSFHFHLLFSSNFHLLFFPSIHFLYLFVVTPTTMFVVYINLHCDGFIE